jgi:hypothetical protein
METSILTSTKKTLGLDSAYTVFDLDIITFINSAFSTLTDLGVGPAEGFMIEDDSLKWEDYISDATKVDQLNHAKVYVYLRTRILFDPPTTAYLQTAFEKQLEELEWRLNVEREATEYVDPDPDPVLPSRDPSDGWMGGLIFNG